MKNYILWLIITILINIIMNMHIMLATNKLVSHMYESLVISENQLVQINHSLSTLNTFIEGAEVILQD